MLQSGRSVSTGAYRFGFNGMENDNKKGGLGEHIDFGARGLNTWTGKFYGIDPLWAKYPNVSSYASMGNNPILMRDFDGRENTVYVVFLPSSKLSPTEKQAVIAEMQRIYSDVIGLRSSNGSPLIQVTEFNP